MTIIPVRNPSTDPESTAIYERRRAICIATAIAYEQDALAIGADGSNFAAYRQGERVAKQIAEMIDKAEDTPYLPASVLLGKLNDELGDAGLSLSVASPN